MLDAIFGTPKAPPTALARLRAVDPRLGLRFVQGAAGSYWAFTRTWADDDPRRAAIQMGHMSPDAAQDIVATLPGDCSPDEAGSFVEANFWPSADPGTDAIKRVTAAVEANQAAKQEQMQRFIDDQTEKVLRTTSHDRELMAGAATAHPMVPGVGAGTRRGGSGKRGRSSDTPATPTE